MEYVLQTNALTMQYGHFKALDGLSVNVPKGSIYGLVGRNGSGKTTLFRIVSGLQLPSAGEYKLYGVKNTDKKITAARRRMGAIVETPSIYLNLTARENMLHQYAVLGRPSDEGIDELLSLVGLHDTGKKKAKNFSLGMRQRLGIAVALAGNPDLLLLDEPVNGLDPQGIVEMRELILKLNTEHQITFIISSHILDELARIATDFGFVDRGHVVKEISAKELAKRCRKCILLTVSNVEVLSETMEALALEYSIISESEAEVYGDISITRLVRELDNRGCEVFSILNQGEDLESYYIRLIGGEADA